MIGDHNARLQEVTNRMFDIQRLMESLPNLKSAYELNSQTQIIQHKLQNLEAFLDDGYYIAAECDTAIETKQITQQLDKQKVFLDDLRKSLRQAKLKCRVNLQKQADAARIELLQKNNSARRTNELVNDRFSGEVAKQKSKQSTESLQRTREIVANEIARTSEALDMLGKANKTLEDTYGEHKGYAAALRQGKNMISQLERRERTDAWLVKLGFAFFCLCVLYILKKRLMPSANIIYSMIHTLLSPLLSFFPSFTSPVDENIVTSDITNNVMQNEL